MKSNLLADNAPQLWRKWKVEILFHYQLVEFTLSLLQLYGIPR